MAKNILVPIDGSDNALHALQTAIEMAKAFGEEIILLNVQPDIESHRNIRRFISHEEIVSYQTELAEEVLKPAAATIEAAGLAIRTEMRAGNPKAMIHELANQEQVRAIVIGSRGLGPITGNVLGSVSYGVLHGAACPVMVVPYPGE